MSITAGALRALSYNEDTKRMEQAATVKSPVFTIKQLSYWEWQEVLALESQPVEEIRKALDLALVDIDGDVEQARSFRSSPPVKLVGPLFHAIVEFAAGN